MITVLDIAKATAEYYGVPLESLYGSSRQLMPSEARHVAMHLACVMTPRSLKEIAFEFERKDHTAVIYGRDKIAAEAENIPRVRDAVNNVKNTLVTKDNLRRGVWSNTEV